MNMQEDFERLRHLFIVLFINLIEHPIAYLVLHIPWKGLLNRTVIDPLKKFANPKRKRK